MHHYLLHLNGFLNGHNLLSFVYSKLPHHENQSNTMSNTISSSELLSTNVPFMFSFKWTRWWRFSKSGTKELQNLEKCCLKSKNLSWLSKRVRHAKYKIELSLQNFGNFFNFLCFKFLSSFSIWFLVFFNNQSSWIIRQLIVDSNWFINWKRFRTYSSINTPRKSTSVSSNLFSDESKNLSHGFPIQDCLEVNNSLGIKFSGEHSPRVDFW